ncbi:hypothetical protein LAUMK42_03045 [Mycobacterium persicum]|uniref:Uncharacterized protein n=1 Tax=Mycobacterium persicum TaxID=1487726 RepID=A0AB38UUQ9_9MYCO|nr:hypothetical protein LAUMK42_03045 [Mycobacterium persicum]
MLGYRSRNNGLPFRSKQDATISSIDAFKKNDSLTSSAVPVTESELLTATAESSEEIKVSRSTPSKSRISIYKLGGSCSRKTGIFKRGNSCFRRIPGQNRPKRYFSMVSIDRVANTKCSAPMRSESVTINQPWSFAPMKSRISPNDAQNIARPSSLRDPGVSVYPAIFPHSSSLAEISMCLFIAIHQGQVALPHSAPTFAVEYPNLYRPSSTLRHASRQGNDRTHMRYTAHVSY